ncbi:MAG TPA: AbrB/MazE/SpoVT family DNA-binding domain-containing protein [Pseudonocardiaceae bacterium]
MHEQDKERGIVRGPGGRTFYGSVTVGERGQVVIPAQARRDHDIHAGDKLIVLGSEDGIALMTADALMQALGASSQLLSAIKQDAGRPAATHDETKDTDNTDAGDDH